MGLQVACGLRFAGDAAALGADRPAQMIPFPGHRDGAGLAACRQQVLFGLRTRGVVPIEKCAVCSIHPAWWRETATVVARMEAFPAVFNQ